MGHAPNGELALARVSELLFSQAGARENAADGVGPPRVEQLALAPPSAHRLAPLCAELAKGRKALRPQPSRRCPLSKMHGPLFTRQEMTSPRHPAPPCRPG